jgi:hypothetical protein
MKLYSDRVLQLWTKYFNEQKEDYLYVSDPRQIIPSNQWVKNTPKYRKWREFSYYVFRPLSETPHWGSAYYKDISFDLFRKQEFPLPPHKWSVGKNPILPTPITWSMIFFENTYDSYPKKYEVPLEEGLLKVIDGFNLFITYASELIKDNVGLHQHDGSTYYINAWDVLETVYSHINGLYGQWVIGSHLDLTEEERQNIMDAFMEKVYKPLVELELELFDASERDFITLNEHNEKLEEEIKECQYAMGEYVKEINKCHQSLQYMVEENARLEELNHRFHKSLEEDDCAVCLEALSFGCVSMLGCGHIFHLQCIVQVCEHEQVCRCPLCRNECSYRLE